jgi:hypothetical protein
MDSYPIRNTWKEYKFFRVPVENDYKLLIYRYVQQIILATFAKLRKATISFVMSACPFVRIQQLRFSWKDFHEILYFSIFRKSVEEIEVLLKSDKKNMYFACRLTYIFNSISQVFQEWEIFQTSCRGSRTHILCSVVLFLFFLQSCRLWENGAEYGGAGQATDNNIIWRARFACRITKAKDTHQVPNTLCFSMATMLSQTYRSAACLVNYLILKREAI